MTVQQTSLCLCLISEYLKRQCLNPFNHQLICFIYHWSLKFIKENPSFPHRSLHQVNLFVIPIVSSSLIPPVRFVTRVVILAPHTKDFLFTTSAADCTIQIALVDGCIWQLQGVSLFLPNYHLRIQSSRG